MSRLSGRLAVLALILGVIGAFVAAGSSQVQKEDGPGHKHDAQADKDFPRHKPGKTGPVGSSSYLGKMVPGPRDPSLPPMPVATPDLPKLAFKMVDGFKEFHLHLQPDKRELLLRGR